VVVLALGWAGALGASASASAATDPAAPAVLVGCLGVDPGTNGSQIRVGVVVSGPDGLYRAVLAGPSGPVQGEGRVAGGRGLIIVPPVAAGAYDDLLLTDVDTGQAVDRTRLDDALPLMVGSASVACDPAALVVPADATSTSAPTTATSAPSTASTAAPTPDISAAAPLKSAAPGSRSTTTDAPPWLLLAIPGALLVAGGIVLLVRARSRSRSRPAT
jgi:hypothetical protein